MSALMAGSIAFTSTAAVSLVDSPSVIISQEKTQIKPDELPEAVKKAIAADESLKTTPVVEAWKVPTPEGKFHFKVGFDNGSEEKLWKTYDEEGNVVGE